jgi:hypothetical protein
MGATTVTRATERAAQLRKRIIELGERRRHAEAAHSEQNDTLAREAHRRMRIIESLANAGKDAKSKLHAELDAVDADLREAERLGESFGLAIKKIAGESAGLTQELNEVVQTIEAEERANALEAFRIKLQHAARRAGESLDAARADLAALTILETNAVLAGNGNAAHEGNIHRICEPILEEFTGQQANLDSRGWRLFKGFRGLQFLIRPMTRG